MAGCNKDLGKVKRGWMIELVLGLTQEHGSFRRECVHHTQQSKHEPEFLHTLYQHPPTTNTGNKLKACQDTASKTWHYA